MAKAEEVESGPPDYPATAPLDEQRRAYVLLHMANAEIDAKVLVQAMAAVEAWLKDGGVILMQQGKANLRPVK